MAAVCIVPLALWVTAAPLGPRFAGTAQSLTSIGTLLALAGVSSFALNLVLGGRIKLLESAFGGLDKLYGAHRANGRLAFLLLAGHGVMMAAAQFAASGSAGLRFLLPTGGNWVVTFGLIALVLMAVTIALHSPRAWATRRSSTSSASSASCSVWPRCTSSSCPGPRRYRSP